MGSSPTSAEILCPCALPLPLSHVGTGARAYSPSLPRKPHSSSSWDVLTACRMPGTVLVSMFNLQGTLVILFV